jgi:transglutaminase-like putative cysteine protease
MSAMPETPAQTQEIVQVPNGINGIVATIGFMQQFVKQYKTDSQVRGMALDLTANLTPKVQALFDFVQNQVRYVQDVNGVETVQTPVVTLQNRAGDCDDKATLLAALLESIGHETRFKAVGFQYNAISHVYVETKIGTRWVPLDATEPYEMGWEPPAYMVKSKIIRHN